MLQEYLSDCEEFDGECSEMTMESEQVERQIESYNLERMNQGMNETPTSSTDNNVNFQVVIGKIS
jgi:hypothetical protein